MNKVRQCPGAKTSAAVQPRVPLEAQLGYSRADLEKYRAGLPREIESWKLIVRMSRSSKASSKLERQNRRWEAISAQKKVSLRQAILAAQSYSKFVKAVAKLVLSQREEVRISILRHEYDVLEQSRLEGVSFDDVSAWLQLRDQTLRAWLRARQS